jgi:hypothetical protein
MRARDVTFVVHFIDSGRSPQCKADPKFPEGKDVVLAEDDAAGKCCRNVPYPAPRCGMYLVECEVCEFSALVHVDGRPDDPRTVTMPCQVKRH